MKRLVLLLLALLIALAMLAPSVVTSSNSGQSPVETPLPTLTCDQVAECVMATEHAGAADPTPTPLARKQISVVELSLNDLGRWLQLFLSQQFSQQ